MKKAAKKKVTRKPTVSCAKCHFGVRRTDNLMYDCHRYPRTTGALASHWCGEFKRKQ